MQIYKSIEYYWSIFLMFTARPTELIFPLVKRMGNPRKLLVSIVFLQFYCLMISKRIKLKPRVSSLCCIARNEVECGSKFHCEAKLWQQMLQTRAESKIHNVRMQKAFTISLHLSQFDCGTTCFRFLWIFSLHCAQHAFKWTFRFFGIFKFFYIYYFIVFFFRTKKKEELEIYQWDFVQCKRFSMKQTMRAWRKRKPPFWIQRYVIPAVCIYLAVSDCRNGEWWMANDDDSWWYQMIFVCWKNPFAHCIFRIPIVRALSYTRKKNRSENLWILETSRYYLLPVFISKLYLHI